MSTFARRFILILIFAAFLAGLSSVARADGAAFSQTAPDPGGNPDTQTGLIAQLKFRAVAEWLQSYLGSHFSSIEKMVNHEFSERYILDYKVGRTPDRTHLQVIGHLDSDGLKRWLRTLETKTRGNSISPVFILTSSLPILSSSPSETSARTKDNAVAQTLLTEINAGLQKYNIRLTTNDLARVLMRTPPINDREIATLHDQTGANSAVWVQLSVCKSCGGARMDLYFYNLTLGRRLLARSDDLALPTSDMPEKAKIKAALKSSMDQFHADFEEMVSSGTLTSAAYDLTVEQVDSYKTYKVIEASLGRLDFIVQAVLNRSEPKIAGFQVLSPLTSQELSQRLSAENFGGFHLKPVRVDSKSLVVRYSE